MNNQNQPTACHTTRISRSAASFRIRTIGSLLALPFLLVFGGLVFVQPCTATPFEWEFTGSLNNAGPRTVALLSDGRVLVASSISDYASAELYNRTTQNWTVTGSLNVGRAEHTLTTLPDGRALVAGWH